MYVRAQAVSPFLSLTLAHLYQSNETIQIRIESIRIYSIPIQSARVTRTASMHRSSYFRLILNGIGRSILSNGAQFYFCFWVLPHILIILFSVLSLSLSSSLHVWIFPYSASEIIYVCSFVSYKTQIVIYSIIRCSRAQNAILFTKATKCSNGCENFYLLSQLYAKILDRTNNTIANCFLEKNRNVRSNAGVYVLGVYLQVCVCLCMYSVSALKVLLSPPHEISIQVD